MAQQSANATLKEIKTLFMAMLLGIAAIFMITYYLADGSLTSNWDFTDVNLIVGIVMALMAILMSPFLYVSRIKANDTTQASLSEKVTVYKMANLLRYALIEGGCLVNLVLFYITKNSAHLYLAIACLITFVMNRPSLDKLTRDLRLTKSELDDLRES